MRHIVIGTAGHIDHGKSTLVQALTGIDPDRLKEEKARGITIDLGFAHCRIGETRIAFVDVPGHERFVRNMLAGATGIDAVLLVVAADESVMPQTREHFAICRLLDVRAGVIALTKSDAVAAASPTEMREMMEMVRADVRDLVAGSFLEHAPIIEVSARTGAGLDALRDALVQVAASAPTRDVEGPVRLPIDRVFSMKGFGAVVTGTLVSGCLRVDDEVDLLPSGRRVRVRGLQMHGERVREAASGNRVAANLDDIDTADITRGDVLVTPEAFALTNVCDVVLDLLSDADARPLTHGTRVRVHQGTKEALARVGLVDTSAKPGSRIHARLRLESPMVMTRGDRFVLRAYSPVVTIGGGEVLDPHPPRSALRTAAARERFNALDQPSADAAALVMLQERGPEGLPISALTSRLGLRGRAVQATVDRLATAAVRIGDVLVLRSVLARLSAALVQQVARHHEAQPDSEGLPREEARERLAVSARVFEFLVQELVAAGTLTARERLALPTHRVSVPDADAVVLARVEEALLASGLRPPDPGELSLSLKLPAASLDRLIALLVRQKRLVKLGTLVFHPDVLARLREETRALKADAPAGRAVVNVASFKTRYDVSRKYAIPLLEYLDRERVTRRVGDERVVL
jgi:selenocysteine-specific elongation factor